jgi:Zn-dependent peptidase ImmA (M78 family)
LKVSPVVGYLTEGEIEARANLLLERYGKKHGQITAPPVPVERIADLLLELNLSWGPILEKDNDLVLAFINAEEHTIHLNETRRPTHFDAYPGLFEYTLAHEVGHYELHVLKDGIVQTQLDPLRQGEAQSASVSPDGDVWHPTAQYLCRRKETGRKPPREYQADIFASYLLMPEYLILPAARSTDLLVWRNLYALRDAFLVSISALTNRLNSLGLLYVAPNGTLHRSEAEANGQTSFL